MKHPTPSNFIVKVEESHVSVIFKPSNSDYYFGRLVDPEDIARVGRSHPWRYRRLSIGRSRTDGAFAGCQGNHKPIIAREMLHLAVHGTYWHGSACLAKTRTPPSLPLRT